MITKQRVLSLMLIALFPFLLTFLAVRFAFTEAFVEFLYPRVELTPDPMPFQLRLSIAKMGLRSVVSDKGMEEFKNSGLFNHREIAHMEDVKRLLSFLFGFLYVGLPLWFFGLISLRSFKEIGKVLFWGSLLLELFAVFVLLASFANYQWLFEAFHNLFFDPYSWRFSDQDMLLRVYPLDFWYKATLYTAGAVILLNMLIQSIGFLLWRRGF
ncbi:MAG: TIGR01906 family membrane protein [Aquificaceae bacterium]|nr:TIGR01906 family membrane protein [Aquificaceae bacterium]